MAQSKYRRQLNKVLIHYADQAQPLFDEYHQWLSGVINERVDQIIKQLADKIAQAKAYAHDELDGVYEDYLERLDKKAKSISGADIDKNDILLLESSYYTLNQEEFDVMQDKYEGNRSMERILAGYAEQKNKRLELTHMLNCRFMNDKEKRILAEKLYNECSGWIDNDSGFCVADYVLEMAGDMFSAADKLKE